ncbi:hypothetical protein TNCV_4634031 [Trichonephila clavipes]|nr:hypothetical protein TNCV_4634031 [Trichonephila clavipes]
MGREDELTTEELQEILNEEHQEIQRNVSPSEQEEDKRGPMPTSAINDLLKKCPFLSLGDVSDQEHDVMEEYRSDNERHVVLQSPTDR